jgi:hypothetical protein
MLNWIVADSPEAGFVLQQVGEVLKPGDRLGMVFAARRARHLQGLLMQPARLVRVAEVVFGQREACQRFSM